VRGTRRSTCGRLFEATIALTKAKQEQELQALHDAAEVDKRKLRDSLVRKLRRARDQLTSTTDDDSKPGSVPEDSLNVDETSLQVVLKAERQANETLVMKNASHFKAKRILAQQLQDVQSQFVGAMDHHQTQHQDRLRALNDTVATQDTLIDDLQRELEIAFEEYDAVNQTLQLRQAEMSKHELQEKMTMRFLRLCGASSDVPVPRAVGDAKTKAVVVGTLMGYMM